MQPIRLTTLLLGGVLLSTLPAQLVVYGQAPSDQVTTARTVNLTEEQRHVIKENLKDLELGKAPDNVAVTIGQAAPQGVELHPFPAIVGEKVPQVKSHSFFMKGDQVVIVDPKDKKVADIIN